MKNQGNMTRPNDHNNLVCDPKDMEIYALPGKEFKVRL